MLGDEAASLYERAITGLMKHSMLLYFAYADFEEVTKMFVKHGHQKQVEENLLPPVYL